MKAAGVSAEKSELEVFFKALDNRALPTLVAAGAKMTISMPSGGGGAAAGAGPAAAAAPKEDKKEEAVEEVDMGGLFGDDDDDY
jgi:large subunit ribosomal protein LP2